MADASKIQWCDATFNPWRGCTKVSPGCAHCYADAQSKRNPLVLGVWGPNGTRVVAAESQWREPVKWNRLAAEGKLPDGSPNLDGHRPRVFCASLADVFEDWQGPMAAANGQRLYYPMNSWQDRRPWIPLEECGGDEKPITMGTVRKRLFDLIDATPHLDWLLVTKRPENVGRMMPAAVIDTAEDCEPGEERRFFAQGRVPKVLPNVWLGVSVENQAAADDRIPHLLDTPAAVRFLSCEPLLGPVDLLDCRYKSTQGKGWSSVALSGTLAGGQRMQMVDWVIVGGESGPGARPCNLEWARDIVRQCRAAGVATFVKQMGSVWAKGESTSRLRLDGKGGEIEEWPLDLRVREFPAPAAI